MNEQTAIFAAGCFWSVEAHFLNLNGVIDTRVGYTGGHFPDPTYRDVCSDKTGHAEAVRVVFDADVINYEDLLKSFWLMHDPTTLNRQGPDYGSQYRSAIFTLDDNQVKLAHKVKDELAKSGNFSSEIVTEIAPATEFYNAEEYHQRYYQKHSIHHC